MKHIRNALMTIVLAMFTVLALIVNFVIKQSGKGYEHLTQWMTRQGLLLCAVVAVKSVPITNADATPAVINKAHVVRARLLGGRGIVTAANGDSIGSVYRACRIRSSDMLEDLILDNASWGASCTADIGLYKTARDGGAVVDADMFASAVDMNTANRGLNVLRESGIITVANMEKRVWELLGLSADPQIEYDVALTLVAAAAAAGSACVSVRVNGGT